MRSSLFLVAAIVGLASAGCTNPIKLVTCLAPFVEDLDTCGGASCACASLKGQLGCYSTYCPQVNVSALQAEYKKDCAVDSTPTPTGGASTDGAPTSRSNDNAASTSGSSDVSSPTGGSSEVPSPTGGASDVSSSSVGAGMVSTPTSGTSTTSTPTGGAGMLSAPAGGLLVGVAGLVALL